MRRPALPDWWPTAAFAGAVLAGVVVMGAVSTPTPPAPSDDRLGPTVGTVVDDYVAESARSLAAISDDQPRWALVSLTQPVAVSDVGAWFTEGAGASESAAGVRLSSVHVRVPLERVATPTLTVDVPAGPQAIALVPGIAAQRWATAIGLDPTGTNGLATAAVDDAAYRRAAAAYEVGVARLSDDSASVIALTVRADADDLRALAADGRVRAVQALEADAVFGRFAVVPPIPGQDVVGPPPDDGPIPAVG